MPNEKQWFYRKFRHVTNAENWKKGTVEYQLTDWLVEQKSDHTR